MSHRALHPTWRTYQHPKKVKYFFILNIVTVFLQCLGSAELLEALQIFQTL